MNKFNATQITFIIVLISLNTFISGCQKEQKEKHKSTGMEKVIPVTVTRPIKQSVDIPLHAVGSVESLSSPVISGETNGKVISIHVDEGDQIKQGDLLAILDSRALEILLAQEKSELKRNQILIENRRRTLNRRTRLSRSKSISQDSVDEAETELASYIAQKTVLKNKIEAIKYKLDKTQIHSPISATVYKRHISVGDYIKEGEPLFNLVSLARLRIRLPVPENKIPKLSAGQTILLSTPSSIYKTEAKLDQLLPSINEKNKALEVILEIDNPKDWRPGATIIANIMIEHIKDALLIPQQCIVKRPLGDVVYIYEQTSKTVSQQQVKKGHSIRLEKMTINNKRSTESFIHIISGLKVTDQVVVIGASYLTDKAKVSLVQESLVIKPEPSAK